ncbi:MAG TPA: transcriptional regulator, partial [Acidimicrobiales bacterium]
PGAGRPAKLYRRAAREFEVSLPDRRYDLAGWLLASAVTNAERERVSVGEALARIARQVGESLGAEARARAGERPSGRALVTAAGHVLEEFGYDPRRHAKGIELANCPFHALSRDYTDLVCGMNLQLLAGMVAGLGHAGLEAYLDPAPGRCCVLLGAPPQGKNRKAAAGS